MIPSGLRAPLAALAVVIVLGMIFGDDGLIFVTDVPDLIAWAEWWSGWAIGASIFVLIMGGGVPIYSKKGENIDA